MLESYRLSRYVHSASLMRAPDVVLGVGTDNTDDCSKETASPSVISQSSSNESLYNSQIL